MEVINNENKKIIDIELLELLSEKDMHNDTMANLLNELMIIKQDIDILNKLCVRLIDINKSNIVYNGKLYLIDPGNYYINDVNDLLIYYQNKEITEEEKQNLIINWNYNQLNKLMHELLFMNNSDIDFYLLRKIIEFFEIERKKDGLIYDAGIYQKYFDKDLTVREAIKKFVSNYIKVDEEEKKMVLSLFKM